MALVTGKHPLCLELCTALGLKEVKSLDLHMAVGDIVTAKAEFYVIDKQLEKIVHILKDYYLCEKRTKVADNESIEKTIIGDGIRTFVTEKE